MNIKSIKTKIAFLVMISAMLVAVSIGFISMYQSHEAMVKSKLEQLDSVKHAKKVKLKNIWV